MADFTFACPLCNQNIQCDELWCGHQLQCPICQGQIIVPQTVPAPTPVPTHGSQGKSLIAPPAGGSRLAFQQDAQKPATPGKNIPIRNLAPPPPKKKSPVVQILIYAGVVAAVGAGVYFFGWPMVQKWQSDANAKRREVEKNADGGQVGHIANLYEVLDATEPSNPRLDKLARKNQATGPRQRPSSVPGAIPLPADGNAGATPAADKELPVVPATWTLEVDQAQIPEGRVNGMIAGTNFVAETVRVDAVGTSQVLRLFQGTALSPDREILVYLHLKAGDKLSGHTWTISKDMKASADVPQVIKRWKAKAGFQPALNRYTSGYAMKLELGEVADGTISGKIFVALPDPEQSVVAGVFKATMLEPAPTAAPGAAVSPTVTPTPVSSAAVPGAPNRTASDRRYGTR